MKSKYQKTTMWIGTLAAVMLSVSGGIANAVVIPITSTDFTVIDSSGASVSNVYFSGEGHVAMEYTGALDALTNDATFEMQFAIDSAGSGIALWFNKGASAEWLFIEPNRIKNFTGRDLVTHNGGTATITTWPVTQPDKLVVNRTVSGSNIALDIEVFDGATSLYSGTVNYTAPAGEEWGISLFTVAGANTTLNSLSVTVVPEPASLALLGLGGLLMLRRRSH